MEEIKREGNRGREREKETDKQTDGRTDRQLDGKDTEMQLDKSDVQTESQVP